MIITGRRFETYFAKKSRAEVLGSMRSSCSVFGMACAVARYAYLTTPESGARWTKIVSSRLRSLLGSVLYSWESMGFPTGSECDARVHRPCPARLVDEINPLLFHAAGRMSTAVSSNPGDSACFSTEGTVASTELLSHLVKIDVNNVDRQ